MDETNLNSIIAGLKHPINTQIHDVLLLVDHKGHFKQHWNTSGSVPPSIMGVMLAKPSLFAVLRSIETRNLNDLDYQTGPYVAYASQEHFFHHEMVNSFYTRHPALRLTVNPVGNNLFLVNVALTRSYQAAYDPRGGGLIWLDVERESIEGLSSSLFSHLVSRFSKPYDVLGLPVGEILSPSPFEIVKKGLNARPVPRPESFSEIVSLNTLQANPSLFQADLHSPVFEGEGHAVWDNRSDHFDFLWIKTPVSPERQDFIIDVDFELLKGDWPVFIMGKRLPYVFPDAYGYTAGASSDNRAFFIKKEGNIIRDAENNIPSASRNRIRFIKSGFNLHFFVNERLVVQYHDFDFLDADKLYPYLGLRPGSAIRMHGLSIRQKESEPRLSKGDSVVRLLTDHDVYFTLKHVNSYSLQSNKSLLNSFSLHNVTSFERDKKQLMAILSDADGGDSAFVGESQSLAAVRENARTAARSGATILIQGETGSGKEVLARYIHQNSPFAKGPFIKVDCSTLSPTLIESELFGHEKGSFTGATERRTGRFEEADKGLLFLDEVSNLSAEIQAKLLNFLQDFTITRVGGAKMLKISLQVVAASNIPLETLVEKGLFRRDLFFRLNVFSFTLPPLRNRLEDLPKLCETFIRLFAAQHGKAVRGIEGSAYRRLFEYPWPGNIRELKNVLQRAVVYCDGAELTEDHLKLANTVVSPHAGRGTYARKNKPVDISANDMAAVIAEHQGNVSKIARHLGVTRVTVYKLAKKHGIMLSEHRNHQSSGESL